MLPKQRALKYLTSQTYMNSHHPALSPTRYGDWESTEARVTESVVVYSPATASVVMWPITVLWDEKKQEKKVLKTQEHTRADGPADGFG
jgi:hypothetical protein